tara:strand:+ start:404 stop:718 length:315 start_codon:yes stop_codon:yes gene_type:complete
MTPGDIFMFVCVFMVTGCLGVCVKKICCNEESVNSIRIDDLEEQIEHIQMRNARRQSRREEGIRSAYIEVTPTAPQIDLSQTINSEDLASVATVEALPIGDENV